MSLSTIIAAVMADPLMAGVTSHVGKEFLSAEEGPPRVVVVPISSRFEAPEPHSRPNPAQLAQRAIWTRILSVDAYLWQVGTGTSPPDDVDATETLLNNFLAACQRLAPGAIYPMSERWLNEDELQVDLGRGVVLGLELRLAVAMPADSLVTFVDPTKLQQTMQMGAASGSPSP